MAFIAVTCLGPAGPASAWTDWPPGTRISATPPTTTTSTSASFAFYSTESDSTFECRLDGGTWIGCGSPETYPSLAAGPHTFHVRAIDRTGQRDPTPSSFSWTITSPPSYTNWPPGTRISATPPTTTTSTSASFAFYSTESDSTFECRLDGGTWIACGSPKTYPSLPVGPHTFHARAIDRTGQRDPTPSSFSWTITASTPPPDDGGTPPPTGLLMFEGFDRANGSNDVITNEYAGWHAWDSTAVHSPVWRSDGGSLFSVDASDASGQPGRVGSTGRLDSGFADKYSQNYTHSNKMRFWTKANGFDSVRIDLDIKPQGWHSSAPSSWAGFKFYLRRQADATKASFYTVEPYIKDGKVYIQKKCTGNTGGGNYTADGTYYLLASKGGYSVPLGSWQEVAATARTNADGSVTLGVWRNGTLIIQATDRGIRSDGTGCRPLIGGHLGFRSDYLQYQLDNLRVSPLL
jgi:hypothetical protein